MALFNHPDEIKSMWGWVVDEMDKASGSSVVIDYGQTCQTRKVNKIAQSICNWSGLLTRSQQTNEQTNVMARNGVM